MCTLTQPLIFVIVMAAVGGVSVAAVPYVQYFCNTDDGNGEAQEHQQHQQQQKPMNNNNKNHTKAEYGYKNSVCARQRLWRKMKEREKCTPKGIANG
jgi:cytochrome c oxidase assembly protein Cox11